MNPSPGRSGAGRIGLVTAASIAGQAPAVAVPIVMAWRFGASACSDALFLALALATFVVTSVQAVSQTAVVPFLVDAARARGGLAAVLPGVRRTMIVSLLTVGGAGTLAALAWFPSNRGCGGRWPAYLAALIPYIAAASFCGLATAALNAQRDYAFAAVSPVVRWGGVLICIAGLAPVAGFWAAPLGFGLGETIRWIALERRRTAVPVPDSSDSPALRLDLTGTAVAQIAASALIAGAPVIDRLMVARALDPGSVSLLEYVERIWQVPVGLAVSGLLVVALAEWSHQRAGGATIADIAGSARRVSTVAGAVALLLTVMVVMGRHRAAVLLFRHSAIDPHTLDVLADTLAAVFVATPIYVAGLTYGRALLVLKRSDWLLIAAACQLVAKIASNLWLMPRLGLPGIGLSTAMMYTVGSVVLIGALHREATRAAAAARTLA